ncbi:ferrous iron transporter B [Bryobacter aggregatus]|uniref:ferrous iron transporter B n=1 Tax=Bryobacter aggregatus TaxID=360054 RepID=UPI0004E20B0F|nr:ferrous iron transporter B [Bryobacter aggregatus]
MSDCHSGASATLPDIVNPADHRLVALIGPPNTGKSTLFNRLTGLRQKVANYPGVTVEQHIGTVRVDLIREVTVVDLPGVYSLDPRTEDEQVTHDVLKGLMPNLPKPDAVLLILDSTSLPRQLMLAAPVLSLGIPTLVLLNMSDDLSRRGGSVDPLALADQLGAPVMLISAANGTGINEVRAFLSKTIPAPTRVELPVLNNIPSCRRWSGQLAAKAGYNEPAPPEWSRRLDRIFLHRIFGPLLFLFVVLAVFQSIFTLAQPLMEMVEAAVQISGKWIEASLPETWFRALLVEGVWGGVGSVIVFLPQILILFAFIAVLEDSGYLARAAVIADRTMAKVGLQGKSFIPLLSGYACAIPAIMSTRTIENKRDRIATILITPLMTCSARLPVYTMLIAAFIPNQPLLGGIFSVRAAVMLGLYVLAFAAAAGTARLLKSTIFKSEATPFVLELPPYRVPKLLGVLYRLLDRAKIFLKRASTTILLTSIILWTLAHLPQQAGTNPPIEESYAGQLGKVIEPVIQPLGFNWRIGVGLISSLAAREVIIGTLGTIYGIQGEENSEGLQAALKRDLDLPAAVALLIFFAFALQCMSTLAVVRKETGTWLWPIYQFVYMGFLAYVFAWLAHTLLTRI